MKEYFGCTDGYSRYYPQYKCACSREKTADILRSLGKAEVDAIIAEEGVIKVNCEFCNAEYVFDKSQAEELFADSLKDE